MRGRGVQWAPRAARILSPQEARQHGVRLEYVAASSGDLVEELLDINGARGYDDVLILAPNETLVEQGGRLLGRNGCLNCFAGPGNADFTARVNFFDIHYAGHVIVGSTGGTPEEMKEALAAISEGKLNPAAMITHIGGLDSSAHTLMNLPDIPGGKKLIYPQKSIPLTAIQDFAAQGKTDPFLHELAAITENSGGLWSTQAEQYLLGHAPNIE